MTVFDKAWVVVKANSKCGCPDHADVQFECEDCGKCSDCSVGVSTCDDASCSECCKCEFKEGWSAVMRGPLWRD